MFRSSEKCSTHEAYIHILPLYPHAGKFSIRGVGVFILGRRGFWWEKGDSGGESRSLDAENGDHLMELLKGMVHVSCIPEPSIDEGSFLSDLNKIPTPKSPQTLKHPKGEIPQSQNPKPN